MIAPDALYLQLRQGTSLGNYRNFIGQPWYPSLSRDAVRKVTTEKTNHLIVIRSPAEFLTWAEDSGFWSEEEIGRLASLVLTDLVKVED